MHMLLLFLVFVAVFSAYIIISTEFWIVPTIHLTCLHYFFRSHWIMSATVHVLSWLLCLSLSHRSLHVENTVTFDHSKVIISHLNIPIIPNYHLIMCAYFIITYLIMLSKTFKIFKNCVQFSAPFMDFSMITSGCTTCVTWCCVLTRIAFFVDSPC